VYGVVHGDEEYAVRGCSDVGVPAVEQDGNVMVPVQKDEFLFVNENEKSVEQFPDVKRSKCIV
jgi:uncharacterized Zn finger protein (UPF0148 family)